jgi:two-component system, sensor histidine kinase and response regulator
MSVKSRSAELASPLDWLATLCRGDFDFDKDGDSSCGRPSFNQAWCVVQSLLDSLPLGFVIKDRAGRRVFANRRYLQLHNATIDEVLGRTDFDLFPEELAREMYEDDQRVFEQGETVFKVDERTLPDGRTRWIERTKSPLKNELGDIVGVQVLLRDVSDRHRAEQALRLERHLLHTLMDNIPDAIYFKDRDSRFLRISRQMAEKCGLGSQEGAIGKTDADVFTSEHAQQAFADEQEIIRTGEPLVARVERETWPDREPNWVSTTKMPMRDDEGRIIGTFGISRDVTELKKVQEELVRARDAADAASRAKGDFLANMSHEIRTPLNGIIGMTELLLNTDLAAEQRDYQEIVKSSADTLLWLLNDILDFSKIEAGKLELEQIPFDLEETIGVTMRAMAARATEKGLELAVHIPPEAPKWLVGDPGRLRQIVVNLVGNAIKFTAKGEIVVDISVDSATEKNVMLHVAVRDTGIGIPADKRQRIFEAFCQEDASTTRRYGGTGLGLTISAQLVELMGGKIWVDSEVGKGSTFHFTVQLAPAAGARPAAPAELASLYAMPVLVVDDNETNRRICQELLTHWGMKPITVSSGGEALDILRSETANGRPVRLVLLDVMMPHMDGFEVAERIAKATDIEGTTILMLSSAGRSEHIERATEVGVARCLTKPVTQSELLDAITNSLGVAAATAESPKDLIQATKPTDFTPRRVLLAEDGLVNQKVATILLERRGHLVTVANTGEEVLDALGRERYDMVLMDVQMPIMDGFEATAAIRKDEEKSSSKRLPIIAMTAHAMKGDRERCLDAGMDGYLSKPFRPNELFQAVEQFEASKSAALREVNRKGEKSYSSRRPRRQKSKEIITPNPNLPVFDKSEALHRVGGESEVLADLVTLFSQECPKQLDRIEQAYKEGDLPGMARAAHALKSSVAIFAAPAAHAAALQLEMMGRDGDAAEFPTAWETLHREIDRLKAALVEECRK